MKKILLLIIVSLFIISCSKEIEIQTINDIDKKIQANIEIENNKILINGKASGTWFFEASFPIELTDENGNILSTNIATANGNWMTDEYVEFNSIIKYNNLENDYLYIIFRNDNPSGLEGLSVEKKVKIKIRD